MERWTAVPVALSLPANWLSVFESYSQKKILSFSERTENLYPHIDQGMDSMLTFIWLPSVHKTVLVGDIWSWVGRGWKIQDIIRTYRLLHEGYSIDGRRMMNRLEELLFFGWVEVIIQQRLYVSTLRACGTADPAPCRVDITPMHFMWRQCFGGGVVCEYYIDGMRRG